MAQMELFESVSVQEPTDRKCSDDKLFNSAKIAIRSGASETELHEIAKRALSDGRINGKDFNAAVNAVKKAVKLYG